MRDGAVFAGYTIERRLGQGGMGAVYLARHPRLPRLLALKLLNEELFSDSELRARFEREADLVAQLEHPNIVTVFDRGADENRLWISMQYIDGVDAAGVDPLTLPPDRAVQIVGETAKALDFAHHKGVLHRDVKPANILLSKAADGQQRVYLTDFGIARVIDDAANRLTRTGTFTATLAYASPEQLTGAEMDGRADQYSLACTLYLLLSGRAPFESVHPAAVIQGHLQQQPPPLSATRPGLPPALDAVLARAMAKRPADRFASCAEFADAARQALQGGPAPQQSRPSTAPQPYPSAAQQGAPQAQPSPGRQVAPQAQPSPVQQLAPQPYATPAQQVASQAQPWSAQQAAQQRSYAPVPHGAYPYRPTPRRRSSAGWIVGLCLGLAVVVAVGIGTWVATADRTPPQRDLEETRQAFAHMLPTAEVATGERWASGDGFGEAHCRGEVFVGEPNFHWTWMGAQPDPRLGEPTAQWQCSYAGSYMIPADIIRWPYVRIFRYDSAEAAQQVIDTFAGATEEVDMNGGAPYTNYKWGSAATDAPRIATVFPNDPRRDKFIMYSYGLGAKNDPSMAQLLDWWKTVPLT
ncbi:protein kinase [Nocardia halotolerans]|uniref:non-specific serine/threonine protein kinase n=1 Tax=Nocardia halotolerans TaxID=1755878 RepID=A0ABV8VGE5_9NOCA